jgi:hypothetical protein
MGTLEYMLMFLLWVTTQGALVWMTWVIPVHNLPRWKIAMAQLHKTASPRAVCTHCRKTMSIPINNVDDMRIPTVPKRHSKEQRFPMSGVSDCLFEMLMNSAALQV